MKEEQPGMLSMTDDSPIARLYKLHALSIMIYVHRHVSSREDVEDLVLEVFLAALEQDELIYRDEQEQLA